MKKVIRFMAAAVLMMPLSACQLSKQSEKNNNQENQSVKTKKETAVSKHDKLLASLPKDAHATDWNLLLVNNQQPLPENYEKTIEMASAQNGLPMDARIFDAWSKWNQAAKDAGIELVLISGYRSIAHQQSLVDSTYQSFINEGYDDKEAKEKTFEYLTHPGCSEHHTGLALDIVDTDWLAKTPDPLIPEYDTHPSQHFLMKTMNDYGFILRYPKGKEEITDIQYESWHFRYVGEENARFITKHGLTLEEYIDLLNERDNK